MIEKENNKFKNDLNKEDGFMKIHRKKKEENCEKDNCCENKKFDCDTSILLDVIKKEKTSSKLKADIVENDKVYVIYIDVPGIKKDDITIYQDNEFLEVTTHRKQIPYDFNYLHEEISYGYNMRKFYIGNNDKERICARLTDGVLEIFIPKIENNANLSRKISIN